MDPRDPKKYQQDNDESDSDEIEGAVASNDPEYWGGDVSDEPVEPVNGNDSGPDGEQG